MESGVVPEGWLCKLTDRVKNGLFVFQKLFTVTLPTDGAVVAVGVFTGCVRKRGSPLRK